LILIIGAGIGGLKLAQGLKKHGIPFRLYERDTSLTSRTQGFRFPVSDEGIDALQECLSPEQYERVKRTCAYVAPGSTNIPPGQLNPVTGESAAPVFASTGAKPSVVHMKTTPLSVDRTTLRSELLRGIEDFVEFGKAMERYGEDVDGVKVTFNDGTVANGSFLVGADGAWSKVRRQLLPDYRLLDAGGRLIYGKTVLTDATVAACHERITRHLFVLVDREAGLFGGGEVMLFPGRDEGLPVPPDYLYWILYLPKEQAPDHGIMSTTETLALASRITAHWHPFLRYIFDEQHDTEAAFNHVATSHPSIPTWNTSSRVTLIGDAIHLMTPSAGT
jgi:2-polyprenyl-6-methoxyphenol hydroxylase-like FAD-dependent oxidoreductase